MIIGLMLLASAILPALAQEDAAGQDAPPAVVVVPGREEHTQARLKDIASLTCTNGYRLLGYGLVVGLQSTGDSDKTLFTEQALKNVLEQMGLRLRNEQVKVENVAAVMVTGELSPFAPEGANFDVTVSSLGDASSLQGGMLLATPLRGPDGEVYAMAQGPVSVGGYGAGGRGAAEIKNHLAVGRAPQGGWVIKPIPARLVQHNALYLTLYQPDFTTATRIAQRINAELGAAHAQALDAATVQVEVVDDEPVALIARLEDLQISPETPARVVINERTGTVAMGEQVRILPVAIAHGGLTVRIRRELEVYQPPPLFSGGETVVVPQPSVEVEEQEGTVLQVRPQATLQDLVRALNALGVKPRDLIAIIQALKECGALQAELVVM